MKGAKNKMKININWKNLVLACSIMSMLLVGCQTQKVEEVPSSSPAPTATEAVLEESIYNKAFENYGNVTELGLIINAPNEEDLSHLNTLEQYEHTSTNQSMLIIPKYNGSKITISTVEYTGERYIAKDVLFTQESTTDGYGLLLKTNRPEGIPQIIVTITYNKKSAEELIINNGQESNTEIKYLKLENEASKKKEGDLVTPIQDATYLQGLNRFSSYEIDVDKDGNNETIEVYCNGDITPDGEYLFDDGQDWALILRKGDKIYPLFEKSYIQLGRLEYTAYIDYDEYEKVHIIVAYKTGATIIYYDCTFDEESGHILRNQLYEANNINILKDWN